MIGRVCWWCLLGSCQEHRCNMLQRVNPVLIRPIQGYTLSHFRLYLMRVSHAQRILSIRKPNDMFCGVAVGKGIHAEFLQPALNVSYSLGNIAGHWSDPGKAPSRIPGWLSAMMANAGHSYHRWSCCFERVWCLRWTFKWT